ncbi:hypothetical protein M2138_000539 [Dysgonomonadaceae bacterium PH5-43]|nr:hypothetical protein [Dysgonomonadaceae bacterium PH5-43]
MKNLSHLLFASICLLVASLGFTSCEDDNGGNGGKNGNKQGVFILNQGGWGSNDAGISFYSPKDSIMTSDIFEGQLGDNAQDMLLYGGKLYISLHGSKTIAVINAYTYDIIEQISTNLEEGVFSPRFFASYENKVYVTAQNVDASEGYVWQIDTTSLKIEQKAKVGINPEGIAYYNNKLYVANSGDYNVAYENTLSIVDITTFTETEKVTIGLNPKIVKTDGNGNLYLMYLGDYDLTPGGFQIFNTFTKEVDFDYNERPIGNFAATNDYIYFYGVYYDPITYAPMCDGVFSLDIKTGIVGTPVIPSEKIEGTPYGIGINPYSKDIYLSTYYPTERGKVHIFDTKGNLKTKETAGMYPYKFIFR